ncbi:MAG: glycosyltransferase family 2 protein [Pyrinomonadaceae bacterium]
MEDARISVIIPTLNEEISIVKTLETIERLINVNEIIIADGGSSDNTVKNVRNYEGKKPVEIVSVPGATRGKLLNKAAKIASSEILWFIHADTRPVQGSGGQIKRYLNHDSVIGGNFEVIFSGASKSARFLTWLYPHLRSMGLVYGDSAFFVRKSTFEEIGGFKDMNLFEDLDLYKRLKKHGRFVTISLPIATSARRFEHNLFALTFFGWTSRQILYWFGFPPRILAKTTRNSR